MFDTRSCQFCEEVTGNKLKWTYCKRNRIGDHIWYISDVSKFKLHYPNWDYKYSLEDIIVQIFEANRDKWQFRKY